MDKDSKLIRILKLVADDVAAIFPFFFAFYLISLAVSVFSPAWREYFNWPAFHASVVALAIISVWSDTVQNFWKGVKDISKTGKGRGFEVANRGVTAVGTGTFLLKRSLEIAFRAVIVPAREKFLFWRKSLGRSGYVKLAVMALILGFSLFRGIYAVDFFVLLFGLVSVLFGLDVRISAVGALALLVLCPFLLAFDQNGIAETAAVYAYYFLVIAVLTATGDIMREKSYPQAT